MLLIITDRKQQFSQSPKSVSKCHRAETLGSLKPAGPPRLSLTWLHKSTVWFKTELTRTAQSTTLTMVEWGKRLGAIWKTSLHLNLFKFRFTFGYFRMTGQDYPTRSGGMYCHLFRQPLQEVWMWGTVITNGHTVRDWQILALIKKMQNWCIILGPRTNGKNYR